MPETGRPDFERLADWAEGRLSEEEALSIARQVEESDGEALAEARWIEAFMRVSADVVLDSPPPEIGQGLMRAFEERFATGREAPVAEQGITRRVMAALAFDSGFQASFGVRSAGSPSSEAQRQLSYETGVADISVSIQPRPGGRFDLLGQALPLGDEDPEDFTVQLVGVDGVEAALTGADDLGEFAFEGVGGGSYQIVIATPEAEILTPSFTL